MTIEATGSETSGAGESSHGAQSPGSEAGAPPVEDGSRQNDPGEWASRFASLTQKEKRLLQQKKQLDAERPEFEEWRRTKALAKTNVPEFLKAHGLTYDQITDIMLKGDQAPPPEDPVALLQKQIDEDRAERKREKEEQAAQAEEKAFENHKNAIRSHVESVGDKYEAIAAYNEYDSVFEVIREYWDQNGKILPIDEACQLVDSYITETVAKKALGLKRFQPQEAPTDDRPQYQNRQPTGENFTITNNSAAASPQASSRGEKISDEEAKRRAAARIQW